MIRLTDIVGYVDLYDSKDVKVVLIELLDRLRWLITEEVEMVDGLKLSKYTVASSVYLISDCREKKTERMINRWLVCMNNWKCGWKVSRSDLREDGGM